VNDKDLVQRVYRAFSPDPLPPERQAALYVGLDEVRGKMEAVSCLNKRIRLADNKPTCQVLAGHKGSGKSTELFRLKKQLESGDRPLFVVYVAADEDVDRNDIDFPDVLIAIVRQVARQLREHAEIVLGPGYFARRMERLKHLLTSEINFESFDLDAGLVKLSGQIKGSPDARREIRKILEPDTSNLLAAANEVIRQGASELAKQGKAGLVVLMDDLDKMVVRERDDSGYTTDAYLFVNRAAQLTAFDCHIVYTLPLSLAYSHHEQTIKSSYGGHLPVVPMTRVAAKPPQSGPDALGVSKFREIITRRLKEVGAKETDVFADETACDKLIALSGGQPMELMTLVREAIIAHDLPIDSESLERIRVAGQREYARFLRADHWPIVEQIRRGGNFARTTQNEPAFRELLDSRAILQYVNDEEWYGLNPMVAALNPPC
jgi:hypothetical protein